MKWVAASVVRPIWNAWSVRKSSVTTRQELKQRLSVKRINHPFINDGGCVAIAGFGGAAGQVKVAPPECAPPPASETMRRV
jgi:hypothetical protein